MKLFLSSYRFGDRHGDSFQDLLDENAKVGVITNARDYSPEAERMQSVSELLEAFSEWDIRPTEIDLRPFFDQPELTRQHLGTYDCIWLAGGNTFVLRKALLQSGADRALVDLVRSGQVVYGGESAGAVVAGPTLQGVEFGDDPSVVPDGYNNDDIWDGLGLVPYSIVPHYESDWEGYERMIDILEEADQPYRTLTDSQVIIIENDIETRLG